MHCGWQSPQTGPGLSRHIVLLDCGHELLKKLVVFLAAMKRAQDFASNHRVEAILLFLVPEKKS